MRRFINEWTLLEVQNHLSVTTGNNSKVISFKSAGEGNMNYAFRVSLESNETIIIKQSPPFCAKFPQIPAPQERIKSELFYYEQISVNKTLKDFSPHILGFDEELLVLYMTDLGEGSDFEDVYSGYELEEYQLNKLINYLSNLHSIKIEKNLEFKNSNMRALNSRYIFDLPFDDTDKAINLDTITYGLEEVCRAYKTNESLKLKVQELKNTYLDNTQTLIHGDFYPRSWLKTNNGLFIIDPEFSFYGHKEFDLSILIAHMEMSGQGKKAFTALQENYGTFDEILTLKLAAIEVFRRIMYVSQLPLKNDLTFKAALLERSYKTLMGKKPLEFFGNQL